MKNPLALILVGAGTSMLAVAVGLLLGGLWALVFGVALVVAGLFLVDVS